MQGWQVGDPIYREFYGTDATPPRWGEVRPEDLPLDIASVGLEGQTIDVTILPPTIPDGTYVIGNPGRRPAQCTPPLHVTS